MAEEEALLVKVPTGDRVLFLILVVGETNGLLPWLVGDEICLLEDFIPLKLVLRQENNF